MRELNRINSLERVIIIKRNDEKYCLNYLLSNYKDPIPKNDKILFIFSFLRKYVKAGTIFLLPIMVRIFKQKIHNT